MTELTDLLSTPPLGQGLREPLRQALDGKAKPVGALGRIEDLALTLGLIQQTLRPTVTRPVLLVFAADHGLTRSGVAAYPAGVTVAMVDTLLTGRASRVLILVPENLQHQWLVEMRRRFNLQVALFDAERFIESDASNPFDDAQLALVALEWLVEDEKAQDALFAAGWDLMVVDEAHHLVWHEDQVSAEYALVEQLAAFGIPVESMTIFVKDKAGNRTLPPRC